MSCLFIFYFFCKTLQLNVFVHIKYLMIEDNFPPTLLLGTTFLSISKKSSLLHSYLGLLIGMLGSENRFYNIYRTRAVITRGLYIYYPILEDHFFVFKEVLSENSVLMYG